MKQKWHQVVAEWDAIAKVAQRLTDGAWRDEPDVSGGVPR